MIAQNSSNRVQLFNTMHLLPSNIDRSESKRIFQGRDLRNALIRQRVHQTGSEVHSLQTEWSIRHVRDIFYSDILKKEPNGSVKITNKHPVKRHVKTKQNKKLQTPSYSGLSESIRKWLHAIIFSLW